MSQILGYTGPVSGDQLKTLKDAGYLPDDLIGKVGLEAQYETQLRGVYGTESVERDGSGRKTQTLQTLTDARPGDSLTLTIDTKEQQYAQKAMKWAMKEVGIKRGVVIVMNPQTGEVLALVSLPTYDNNVFARGISNANYAKLLKNPDKPLLNHAIQAHYPPGSTYKLVAGHRRPGGPQDHRQDQGPDARLPDPRLDPVLRLEPHRVRAVHDLLRVRALERHVLLPDGRQARHRSPRLLGQAVRLRPADGHRPARRGLRHRPDQPVEAGRARRQGSSRARPTRPGSVRATTWSRRSS